MNQTEQKKDINDIPCVIIKVVNADASLSFVGNRTDKVYKAVGEILNYFSNTTVRNAGGKPTFLGKLTDMQLMLV